MLDTLSRLISEGYSIRYQQGFFSGYFKLVLAKDGHELNVAVPRKSLNNTVRMNNRLLEVERIFIRKYKKVEAKARG